jgi:hypothetical protein
MFYLPLFRLIEKVEQKDQAHSMRYSHRARTFPLMNAQFLQVLTLALSENHKAP